MVQTWDECLVCNHKSLSQNIMMSSDQKGATKLANTEHGFNKYIKDR